VVILGRWGGTAGDPVEEVGVGAFEQHLVAVELALVEAGKMRIGKATKDQVAFASAAMP